MTGADKIRGWALWLRSLLAVEDQAGAVTYELLDGATVRYVRGAGVVYTTADGQPLPEYPEDALDDERFVLADGAEAWDFGHEFPELEEVPDAA